MDFPVSSVHVILQNTGVGSHFLLQRNLFDPGIKPTSQAWQTDSLPLRHQGSIHTHTHTHTHTHMFRLRVPTVVIKTEREGFSQPSVGVEGSGAEDTAP